MRHYILIRCVISIFVLLGLTSCADSVEEIGEIKDLTDESVNKRTSESSTVVGQILSTSPAANATNVDVNITRIVMQFTKNMNFRSVKNGFSITPFVAGSVSKVSRKEVVYLLSQSLSEQTNYTVNLTGAKDADRNPLENYSLNFMTGNSPDTIDTINPSVPSDLRAVPGSLTSSSVELSWNASTDNVAVTGYRVKRNNSILTTTTSTSYTDTSALPLSTYQYSVEAFDAENNTATSNLLTVTTLAAPDVTAPTAPANLRTATSPTSSSVSLAWNASTDNVAVTGYRVKRNNSVLTTTNSTSYTDTSALPLSNYQYSVEAFDAANNTATSNTLSVTTLAAADTTAPTAPGRLRMFTEPTSSSIALIWDASTDNVAVTGYRIKRNNSVLTTTSNTSYIDTSALPQSTYQYSVEAFDAANNTATSNTISVSTLAAADTTAPTVPTNLRTVTEPTSSSVALTWNASTDNVAVTGYRIKRNNSVLTTTSSTSYTDTSALPLSTYQYSVEAFDAENNTATSNTLSVTTLAAADTTAPTVPTNLRTVTEPTSSSVALIWNASTDNVAVTGYRIKRNNSVLTTTSSTSYTDTSALPLSTYQYSVEAFDAENNTATSNTLSVTTLAAADITPPTAPARLRVVTEPTSSSIALTWDAATDDVAVVGYRVMRGNTEVATTTSTTYTDNSVSADSVYSYAVFAFDAADNSTISNIIFINTPADPDMTAPSTPVNLRTASGSPTSSSVQLLWDASTDNIAVTGYRVMRGDTIVITTTNTTFTDINVSPGTVYQYSVVALDEASNESSSVMLSVSTPNNTTGIATLSWNPPTENTDNSSLNDLSGYKIYYGLSADALTNTITITNVDQVSYVIENLNMNTTYYFSITAVNTSNSESDLSNIVSKFISG